MYTNQNSNGNLTELVFENKNKAYGAYAIRRSQADSITVSLLITATFFGLLASFAIWASNNEPVKPDDSINIADSLAIFEVDMTPKKDEPKAEPEKKEPVESPKSTSGLPEPTDKVVIDSTRIDENTPISKNPNPNGKDADSVKTDIGVTGGGNEKKKEENKVHDFVDTAPYMDDMQQFILANLRYPQVAKENGTHGIVVVTFVVEKDGSITNIDLLAEIGDGCEEEAIRVVKKMPVWHPGILRNEPQRTRCNLPIRFKLK